MASLSLRITEIFYSLQGETSTVGLPTAFIRLTGCPLRCQYCDTEYAFTGGTQMTLEDILAKVQSFGARYVTVTGGEPLAQPYVLSLLNQLCESGYKVSLETSGALPVKEVDSRVVKILDLKTPASKESHRNLYENVDCLNKTDQVKFVICNRGDYDWSRMKIDELSLTDRVDEILFSPSHEEIKAKQLAEWILADNLPVRLQLQLHKYLWDNTPGH